MKNLKLLTLFHINEEEWNELYGTLYHSPLTRRLDISLKQLNTAHACHAFFYYTEDMMMLASQIMSELNALVKIKSRIPGAAIEHFQRNCLIEEIKSSNDIEGVRSTRKEINIAIDEQDNEASAGHIRLWGIVSKYMKLQKQEDIAFNNSQDLRHFYDDFILDEIYREDPKNVPDGKLFRAGSVDVWSKTKVIHRGVFPETKIIEMMDNALQILQDQEIPDLVRVSIYHYLFGYIHPFYDGNGRTSRFITSYYLSRILDPLVAIRLSITIKKSLRVYYKLFEDTNAYGNRGDLTPFVTGFLWLILKSTTRVRELLSEKMDRLQVMGNRIQEISGLDKTDRAVIYVLLQATLFSEDGATLSEIAGAIQKNPKTVREHIRGLPSGFVKRNQIHRAHRFSLELQVLAES